MAYARRRVCGCYGAALREKVGRAPVLVSGAAALALVGAILAPAGAQRPATAAASLVFDGVTVVDVEQGKLIPGQRVVIGGNHIQAVGAAGVVKTPKGAQVVAARGKYLIPGLWDMHVHTTAYLPYLLLIASGVTGMRDAYSYVPLDTMVHWQREILAGTRVGPPRQLLTGTYTSLNELTEEALADRKARGANFIKLYLLTGGTPLTSYRDQFFAAAAAARRVGLPFGGHLDVSAIEASDSGISIIDHVHSSGGLDTLCWNKTGSIERCQPVAERLRKNGTWWVPTVFVHSRPDNSLGLGGPRSSAIFARLEQRAREFWAGSLLHGNLLRDSAQGNPARVQHQDSMTDSLGIMYIIQRVDMPLLAGTDTDVGPDHMWQMLPGFAIHAELTMMVAGGLTPLNALRSATLNPAKLLHATDSLGTVAPGKLADLVLLDADPLADITNTTTIRAVVANGRYFDRAALDQLLIAVQAQAKQGFKYWWNDRERYGMKIGDNPAEIPNP